MDKSFHAIATFLHRAPRQAGDPRGARKASSLRQGDGIPDPRDIPDGWIRVAL